ncbi:autotransporter domain-containing protein [Bradyrhizobium sp. B117]|uniref:autotransporter outer membrane beta-barrel domain-containing protein n=1 Tax=Bradyrhizobium sp. B117 TaxID=3140246 RepID=UPI003182C13E
MLASTALAAMLPATGPARAQNATWLLNPANGDFNTAANWVPATVPTGTAVFGASNRTLLTFSADTSVGGWTFNAGASNYRFFTGRLLLFQGAGIDIQGGSAAITNTGELRFTNTATAGSVAITNNSALNFFDTSTAGNAAITNNGGLTFFDATTAGSATITNGSFASLFFAASTTAGSAVITNTNSGTVQFLDNSTAGNAVITNSGTVQFLDNSTAGNAAITDTASGSVDFTASTGPNNDHKLSAGSLDGSGTFSLGRNELTVGGNNRSTNVTGVINDGGLGGSLVKAGTGTMILSGINTYTGGTTVSAGTLQIGNGGTTGSIVGNVADNGTLAFNRSDAVSFGGVISGTGALQQSGTGTLTLSGVNTYTGATTVNSGTLRAGSADAFGASSTFAIAAGSFLDLNGFNRTFGSLSGAGTVTGANSTISGTFAPGNGTPGSSMAMVGNLAFQSVAQYLVRINPATASFANVTGTATLGGATVNAAFAPGSYVARQYTILTAGSVSGTFNTVANTNLPSNLHTTLSYDAGNVFLNLALSFAIASGLQGNQTKVGNALTNFFNTTGGIPMTFAALTPGQLTQASGEGATGSQQTTFGAMNQFMGIMTDPFVAGRGDAVGAPPLAYAEEHSVANAYAMFTKAPLANHDDPRWNVWAAGFGGSQSTDGNNALGSNATTSRLVGTAAGADYWVSPRTLAGFALAGGGTSFSVTGGGSGRSDLFQAGAFVRHTVGAAYLSGALAYGWQDVTTDRTVTIAGVDRLRAQFNATAFSGRAEGGYRYVTPWIGGVGLTPYAAAQFTTFDLPAYAERAVSGANTFALAYGAQSVTDTRGELGLRADKSYAMPNAVLTLRGRAAWAHDFNPDRAIGATFQTLPGASFVVNGAAQAANSALTTASAEMEWINGWSVAATFEGEFSNLTRSYAGKGAVRYQW